MTPDGTPSSSPPPAWEARGFNRAMVAMVLALGAFLTFGLIAQVLHPAWGLWATEIVIFFGVPYALLRIGGQSPLATSGLGRPWLAGLGWGFALGAVNFFALAVPLMWLSRQLLPQEVLDAFDTSKIFQNQRPVDLGFLIAGVCVSAPICEELFFRGTVQKGLLERLEPQRAVVMCALIFSAFHLDPVGFLARFELGVLFGLLALRTGSLWPSIAAHFANNAVSSLAYFATRDAAEEPLVWWVPLSMAAAGSLGLVALVRLARVRPSVVTPPLLLPRPDPKPLSIGEAFFPWALGALVSFGLLAAIDYRAIATNAVEVMVPVTLPGRAAPSALDEEELKAWRKQAREGSLSLEDYKKKRRALAEEIKERPPKS